jgi:hypothetical protein
VTTHRFTVLLTNTELGSRNRYLAFSGTVPETVEVDPLTALDEGERAVAVTVVSTEVFATVLMCGAIAG